MILGNFTPDVIEWTFEGVSHKLEPEGIVERPDPEARHALHKFGARGLVRMQYDDDESLKRKDSMALHDKFWSKQIQNFNQKNEDNRDNKRRFDSPPDYIVEKAELLGLDLLKPWTAPTKEEKADNSRVQGLEQSIEIMQGQMQMLMTLVAQQAGIDLSPKPAAQSDADLQEEVKDNRKKYASLTEKTLKGFVKNNWDDIHAMPEQNRVEIKDLYQSTYQVPFPDEKPS